MAWDSSNSLTSNSLGSWSLLTNLFNSEMMKRYLNEYRGLFRFYAVIFSMTFVFFGLYVVIGCLFSKYEDGSFNLLIIFGFFFAFIGMIFLIRIFYSRESSTGLFGEKFVKSYSGSNSKNPERSSHEPSHDVNGMQQRQKQTEKDVLNLPSIKKLFGIFVLSFILSSTLVFIGSVITLFAIPIIFITITAVPLIWVAYVLKKSIYNQPSARSVLLAFAWGMASTIPSLIMNTGVSILTDGNILLVASVGAPLIEEFWKPWGIVLGRKEVNRELDGVIFGLCCGLGFATAENMVYVLPSVFDSVLNPFTFTGYGALVLVRSFASLVGHLVGPALIGLCYGRYVRLKNENVDKKVGKKVVENKEFAGGMNDDNRFRTNTRSNKLSESAFGALLLIPAGYISGVGLHSMWNSSLFLGESLVSVDGWMLLFGSLAFIVLYPLFEIALIRQIVTLAVIKEMELNVPYSYSNPPPSLLKSGLEVLDKFGIPISSEVMRSKIGKKLFSVYIRGEGH